MKKAAELKKGTTLKKGNRKRTFEKVEGAFVYYSVPSDTCGRYEIIENFEKWMEKAEVI